MRAGAVTDPIGHDRRWLLGAPVVGVAVAGAANLLPACLVTETGGDAIHPFRVDVPEAALVDLRRRLAAIRWPRRETITDQSQGVQLAKMQSLDTGGHFAAWEEPELFSAEMRAVFRSLR
jgi:hypothetical protein